MEEEEEEDNEDESEEEKPNYQKDEGANENGEETFNLPKIHRRGFVVISSYHIG